MVTYRKNKFVHFVLLIYVIQFGNKFVNCIILSIINDDENISYEILENDSAKAL